LWAQVDRLKTEKVAAMKAAGIEYEQRMEELEKVTWPKPLEELIYDSFNAFAAKHPWVGQENIRPKSVAREMLEKFCSFDDYVRDYGLQRSEGVLLRYLSQAYKALLQTVPEPLRTEELDDALDELRALLRAVDSSLLDEWQSLRDPRLAVTPVVATDPVEKHLADDPRALATRVRGELHRLLKSLAAKQYDVALTQMRPSEWTAEKLAEQLKEYWAEHARIDVTPRARRPSQTILEPAAAPRTFIARQKILDPNEPDESEADWMLDCFVDLRQPISEDPIVELRAIRR
jgi:hypothetical protein